MSKRRDVGRSWRTEAKHALMRSIAGQEIGAISRIGAHDRHVFYDLSAGDGVVGGGADWFKTCSPGILATHAANTHLPTALVLLHEIQPSTYDRLLDSLADPWHLPLLGYVKDGEGCWRLGDRVELRTINGSGHDADVSFLTKRDAVLAFNDPNAITEWAMRDTFVQEVKDRAWCCRVLSTMGCNPAGLKRLPLAERLGWFALVESHQAAEPRYRDILLAAIEKDDSQWSYLLSTPQNWRDKTEAVVQTAFNHVGRTAEMAWWRQQSDDFREALLRLFLTKKEEDARALIRGEEDYWLSLDTEQRCRFLTERGASES